MFAIDFLFYDTAKSAAKAEQAHFARPHHSRTGAGESDSDRSHVSGHKDFLQQYKIRVFRVQLFQDIFNSGAPFWREDWYAENISGVYSKGGHGSYGISAWQRGKFLISCSRENIEKRQDRVDFTQSRH